MTIDAVLSGAAFSGRSSFDDATVTAATWAMGWQGYSLPQVSRATISDLKGGSIVKAIVDVLTDDELALACDCESADEIEERVVTPATARIDAAIGQENDPMYLGHAIRAGLVRATTSVEQVKEALLEANAAAVCRHGCVVAVVSTTVAELDEVTRAPLSRCGLVLFSAEELRDAGVPIIEDTPGLRAEVKRVAAQVIIPPRGGSAVNVEAAWMNAIWIVRALEVSRPGMIAYAMAAHIMPEPVERLIADFMWETEPEAQAWLVQWSIDGYARMEVSHRLAAALALTDAPVNTRAPWNAFTVAIPDGMFDPYSRIVCRWNEDVEQIHVVSVIDKHGSIIGAASGVLTGDQIALLETFVRSMCLALHDKPKPTGRHGSVSIPGRKRRLRGGVAGALYQVGKPVTIDLRDAVEEAWTGKTRKGKSPTVQFVVRGHWRNQAHGPKRSLRRRQWIEPFWKGDPEARVLLRGHGLK